MDRRLFADSARCAANDREESSSEEDMFAKFMVLATLCAELRDVGSSGREDVGDRRARS